MQKRNYSGARRRPTSAAPHNRRGKQRSGSRFGGNQIDSQRFINKAVAVVDEAPYQPEHSFEDFGFNSKTVANLKFLGFEKPTPVQDQCIRPALEGRDVIGLANTGTGKTAAFLLPTIEKLYANRDLVSVLVLAPTRELAQQIDEDFKKFAAGQKLFSAIVVGGANINRQIQQVKRGPHVIVGTPGRVKDLVARKVLRLQNVTTFILDEADRMCDMGFVKDIRAIEAELSKKRQTLCFSATMTGDVKSIVEEFMKEPVKISVVKSATNEHIEQNVIPARDKAHKIEILSEMLKDSSFEKVIVFGETKYGVQRLADRLVKDSVPAVAIHGNKSQAQRERALNGFKNGEARVMVATDVAARGLDIPNVSHVINFDPPKQYDDYIHRIGRTGRAGKTGQALTFVTSAKVV